MKKIVLLAVIAAVAVVGGAYAPIGAADKGLVLPQPKKNMNIDVMQTFRERQSARSFKKNKMLQREDLAALLWAGYGVNRPDGKKTVATARGKDLLDLYVALDAGIYKYDPQAHVLVFVAADDIRASIGRQSFVADAPAVIILVGKTGAFPGSTAEQETAYLNYTAGAASQNIYLAAAALKLSTVVAASYDTAVARRSLRLSENQVPLYIMPVGYPNTGDGN
jgi:nitroreductase